MRPLARIARKGITFGGTGGSFVEPPFWSRDGGFLRSSSFPSDSETIANNFEGYVQSAYKANGVIFACILARMLVFSEARFQFQRLLNGRPGDMFGTAELALLENPWPNGTTGELLARMEQDASLAGNFYATVRGTGTERRIRRMRPDAVTILTGSPSDDPFDLDAKVIGYIYDPRKAGLTSGVEPTLLLPSQVVHYSPIPDPEAQWRGMSWLTPVVREVQADSAATKHKLKFFENGTTTNFVVTYDEKLSRDQFLEYVAAYKEAHQGVDNAYKTIHLGGGADVTPVGSTLQQADFKSTQGAGETRIAAAAGVHPVIVGLSEGLAGSSLNAGNFQAARRRFADGTIRPMWRTAAASLAKLVMVPGGTRLWYDDRDIPFLREDGKDAADIQAVKASTISSLIAAGYEPDSIVKAVENDDFTLLVHSGLYSVQLQAAGAMTLPPA